MAEIRILQRIMPHYRVELFDRLARALAADGHGLRVVHGPSRPGEVPVSVAVDRDWAAPVTNRYLAPGAGPVWQDAFQAVRGADLVILEQSGRLLFNYLLLARVVARGARVAFWGHGRNRQAAAPRSLAESVKRALRDRVDWWFAYTEGVAREVAAGGFPADRITAVQNAIDDREFRAAVAACRNEPGRLAAPRARLRSTRVGLYCGGLYREKRIGFLLEAADRVRTILGDFELVVIGDGPLRPLLDDAATTRPWLHVLGPVFGAERVPWFLASRVQLMPGLVGLGVLDSFLAETPLVTTDIPIHSPEIDYLEHGFNGLVTPDDPVAYADAVIELLTDDVALARLAEGCRTSAGRYTLDAMVERFAGGIRACLAST